MKMLAWVQTLEAVVRQLERYLQREAVMPSFRNVIGSAALAALTRLTLSMHGPSDRRDRCRFLHRGLCKPFS